MLAEGGPSTGPTPATLSRVAHGLAAALAFAAVGLVAAGYPMQGALLGVASGSVNAFAAYVLGPSPSGPTSDGKASTP